MAIPILILPTLKSKQVELELKRPAVPILILPTLISKQVETYSSRRSSPRVVNRRALLEFSRVNPDLGYFEYPKIPEGIGKSKVGRIRIRNGMAVLILILPTLTSKQVELELERPAVSIPILPTLISKQVETHSSQRFPPRVVNRRALLDFFRGQP